MQKNPLPNGRTICRLERGDYLHQPRAPEAAPLEPPSAVQVRASPFHRPATRGVQPSALLPAPCPRMSCPLR